MEGWQEGCSKGVNGTKLSNTFLPVENSPLISEYDIFEANGLIEPLKKLINLNIPALKNYNMQLYAQKNLPVNDPAKVKEFALVGLLVDFWYFCVKLSAEWCLYLHVIRVLIDFINSEGALKGICYTIPKWIVQIMTYLCVVFLVFALGRVQRLNLDAHDIETSNQILEFTMDTLQAYCDATMRYSFALLWVFLWFISEVVF